MIHPSAGFWLCITEAKVANVGVQCQDQADTSIGTPHRNFDRHQWALNHATPL